MGIVVTIVSIVVSLIPPGDVRSVWLFEFKLLAGCAVPIVAALVFCRYSAHRLIGWRIRRGAAT